MRLTKQQKINIVSMLCTFLSFVLVLAYWDEFSLLKKLLLFSLMALFIYVMVNNSPKAQPKTKKIMRIDQLEQGGTSTSKTARRLNSFFNQLGEADVQDFSQDKKSPWSRSFMYMYSRLSKPEQEMNQYSQYFTKSEGQKNGKGGEIGLFIPHNITHIFDEIREEVSTKKYLKIFCEHLQALKHKTKSSYFSNKFNHLQYSELYPQNESIMLYQNDQELLLSEYYDVILQDGVYCAEMVCDYLQTSLDDHLNAASSNFKKVSEIVMKFFGKKVNFFIGQKTCQHQNSEDISIYELKDFLYNIRKNHHVPQRFKPIVQMKDFINSSYEKLVLSTDAVVKFLQFSENHDLMALGIYVDVLNKQFKNEIVISKSLNVISSEMKNVKHAFFINRVGPEIYFTYNRIKKFMTKNPLIAVLAYFSENHKVDSFRQVGIVRNLRRFFKQRPKTTKKEQQENSKK